VRFQSAARASVVRSVILFTPFLAITLFGWGYLLWRLIDQGASGGAIFGFGLVSIVALLLSYQVVQSLRDAFAGLVETIGEIEKSWSRNDMFLFRNSYIFVGRDVFRVPAEQAADLAPGDTVRIRHLPHTSAVETLEKIKQGSG
jgi:hypothetical protein